MTTSTASTASRNSLPLTRIAETPDFARRRKIAAGLAAMALFGVFKGGPAIVDKIEANNLISEIKASGVRAGADFNDGKFADKPVTAVTVEKGQSTFGAAVALVAPGKNVLEVQDVIMAETGDTVDPGENLILPRDLVKPQENNDLK